MRRWLFRLAMLVSVGVLALVAYAFSPLPVGGEGATFTFELPAAAEGSLTRGSR